MTDNLKDFSKAEIKLSSDNEQGENSIKSGIGSFVSKIKEYSPFGNQNNQEQNDNSLQGKISRCCHIERNYKLFIIFLLIGIGFVFLSLMFLPMIILVPKKFVTLFSLGSLICIFSFIFYYGTYDFLSMLFNQDRKKFTILFIVSTILSGIFSFMKTFFLINIILSVIQFLIMITFILSFLPGGKSGIMLLMNLVFSPIIKIFKSQEGN